MMIVAQFPSFSRINPYLCLFGNALKDAGMDLMEHEVLPGKPEDFPTWVRCNASKIDVLHLHWYQQLYLRRRRISSIVALIRMLRALRLARRNGVVVTWTIHNVRPHERPFPIVDELAGALTSRIVNRAFVESATAIDDVVRVFPRLRSRIEVVTSGSYRGVYPEPVSMEQGRKHLGLPDDGHIFLAFGLFRRYKRVPELIESFGKIFRGSQHRLLVAGEPHIPEEENRLMKAASNCDNVVLRLRRVDENDIPFVFGAANYTVCNYAKLFNSGIIDLSSTYGRAVVAPISGTARGIPQAGIIPIYDDRNGIRDALKTALASDWQERGAAARNWAIGRDWAGTASSARRAWHAAIESE